MIRYDCLLKHQMYYNSSDSRVVTLRYAFSPCDNPRPVFRRSETLSLLHAESRIREDLLNDTPYLIRNRSQLPPEVVTLLLPFVFGWSWQECQLFTGCHRCLLMPHNRQLPRAGWLDDPVLWLRRLLLLGVRQPLLLRRLQDHRENLA